jgi:UDP-3-O-[3-hydroxymyristoyl] glucosamine N-acyltransferase
VDHPKYYTKALNSAATVILINKKVDCPEGKALLISEDPFNDFNRLTNHFKPFESSVTSISTSAVGQGLLALLCGNHVVIGKIV